MATFLTPPESDEVLMRFYRAVKPWGLWKPVREKVLKASPSFVPNGDFKRDMVNVVVGTIWQVTLMSAPVFLVIREWESFFIALAVMVVTSLILKFNWWDKLEATFGEKKEEAVAVNATTVELAPEK